MAKASTSYVGPYRLSRVLFCAGVLAVVGFLALAMHGNGPTTIGATPGYESQARTRDMSPFEMARSQTNGPTTIPPGSAGIARTTTTTAPPAPTTTLVPLPDAGGDGLCQAVVLVGRALRQTPISEQQAIGNPPTDLPDTLFQAAALLEDSGLAGIAPLTATARSVAADLTDARTYAQIRAAFAPLFTPDAATLGGLAALTTHVDRACPGLGALTVN